MACQSKTFINDLGSAVVAEITNQLNTASGYLQWNGAVTLAAAGTANIVIGHLGEDVMIEDVVIALSSAGGPCNSDTSSFSLVTGVAVAGTGGSVAIAGANFVATNLANDQFASFKEDVLAAATTESGVFPLSVNAGTSLGLRIILKAGDTMNNTVVTNVIVRYRPIKDKMTLSPAQSVKAFSTVNR